MARPLRRRRFKEVEGLLLAARPELIEYDESRVQAVLADLMERYDELAPGAAAGPETVLSSAAPAAVVFDTSKFRETGDDLARRFDELAAGAGRNEADAAASPARARGMSIFRVGLASGFAVLLALGLFFALSRTGNAPHVAVKHPPRPRAVVTTGIASGFAVLQERAEALALAAAGQSTETVRRERPWVEKARQEEVSEPGPGRRTSGRDEGPQPPPEVKLAYYTLTGNGISLSWSYTSGAGAAWDGAVVLRAPAGVVPVYPTDQISSVLSDASFIDSTVHGGRTYSYRVAVIRSGAPVSYSDVLSATASTIMDVSLTSETRGGLATLRWDVSTEGLAPQITGYTVFKSRDGSNLSGATSFDLPASARSFMDDVSTGPYYYRVVALDGAQVLATSNTVAAP